MDYQKPFRSNFPYFTEVLPTSLPVSLAEVKEWARLDPLDTSQDGLLTSLIESCSNRFSELTGRAIINTTFKTLRDFFSNRIELRRSQLQSIVSFQYTVDDILIPVDPSLFYIVLSTEYSSIFLKDEKLYPTDGDPILQGIEIQFVAGFGTSLTSQYSDIKEALKRHITWSYENRGDCTDEDNLKFSLSAYKRFRILGV